MVSQNSRRGLLPILVTVVLLNIANASALDHLSSNDSSGMGLFGYSNRSTASAVTTDRAGAAAAYIYRPSQVPLDVEGYPAAPDGLELKQVHIYVRHGERTPVGIRLADPPASIAQHWIMCRMATQFRAMAYGAEGGDDGYLRTTKMVERVDGSVVEGECLLGELTDVGRQSTYLFGRHLRKLYVDRLGFLPDLLSKQEHIYFRSTNIPRTIESLQEIIHGLYPSEKCQGDSRPTILIRNSKDENLLGNTYSCKRLEILQLGFAQAAATAYNPILERFDKQLAKYLNGNGLRVDGKPRASGVMDTIRAAVAHGIQVPPEFKNKIIVDTIEAAVVNEWFAGCEMLSGSTPTDKTEEGRRLGMGRLLDDLARKMQHKVDKGDRDPLKLLLHTTHDTALAALCSTLDVFDEQWPAFTASITFELFKKQAPDGSAPRSQSVFSSFKTTEPTAEHFVRMRYQNKNMVLPICAEEGKHLSGSPEFCTLAAFRERVEELTPTDWDVECAPTVRSN